MDESLQYVPGQYRRDFPANRPVNPAGQAEVGGRGPEEAAVIAIGLYIWLHRRGGQVALHYAPAFKQFTLLRSRWYHRPDRQLLSPRLRRDTVPVPCSAWNWRGG